MPDNMDLDKGGVKYDQGKLTYDLVPVDALEQVVEVLTYGANKYKPRNWEVGMRWGRPFAAAMRHMWAWWRGEDNDPETGFSHLAHAACCIFFLLSYARRHVGEDDRANELARPTVLSGQRTILPSVGTNHSRPQQTPSGSFVALNGISSLFL